MRTVRSFLFVVLVLLQGATAQAGQGEAPTRFCGFDTLDTDHRRYLGIGSEFSRWLDGEVRIVYNPEGSPAQWEDVDAFEEVLMESFAAWESVSGVRFIYEGVTNFDPDEDEGVVVIHWVNCSEDECDWGGRAGPRNLPSEVAEELGFDRYHVRRRYGYWPYFDGHVELNDQVLPTEWHLTHTLIHELGHVLGAGHSDNPESLMYANPYTLRTFLSADDVAFAQALYGPPDDRPLYEAGRYEPPAGGDSYLRVSSEKFCQVPEGDALSGCPSLSRLSERNASGLVVYVFEHNAHSLDEIRIAVTDPKGYLYDLSDPYPYGAARTAYTAYFAEEMLALPGTWSFHLIHEGITVSTTELLVEGGGVYGVELPGAEVVVAATIGEVPMTVDARVVLEGEPALPLDIDWHIPRTGRVRGADSTTFTFDEPGEYTVFVTLDDGEGRYDSEEPGYSWSGDAYRRVLRKTFTVTPIGGYYSEESPPQPRLRIDGESDSVSVAAGEIPRIQVAMDAFGNAGLSEWYLTVETPRGVSSYVHPEGWSPGIQPAVVIPVRDLNFLTIPLAAGMWAGDYTFRFSVDQTLDGIQDDGTPFAQVEVHVE